MGPGQAGRPRRAHRRRPGVRPDLSGKEGETFKAGDLGEFTIEKDGVVSLGKPTVFDKQNIDQFKF